MNNREMLIEIIVDHDLERRDVAELLSVDRDTVDRWLAPGEAGHSEPVPTMAVELLALKLKDREPPAKEQAENDGSGGI